MTEPRPTLHSALAEHFSITRGGALYRILTAVAPQAEKRRRVGLRAAFGIALTWLPLLILSLAQGRAYGAGIGMPFLRDFAVNARFLLVLPILILAEASIDRKWRSLVLEFIRSGLVGERELPAFESVIQKTLRLRDRILPEVVIAALAILPFFLLSKTDQLFSGVSNWHTTGAGAGSLTWAGWYFSIACMPIFRFLLLRWVWRMFIWTSFLWRASRANLYLVATHSDMAAGLGFLSTGQKSFTPIVFAGGIVIAAQVANAIAYQGQTLSSLKLVMIAYGVLAVLLLIVPLLAVTPALIATKKRALLEYGELVTTHNQLFETKWIRDERPADVVILGNPDASSLIDLGDAYTVIRNMTIVPIDKPTLAALAVGAALPILVVILFVTPASQIIQAVLKMLA
jgi:hypothetical protein